MKAGREKRGVLLETLTFVLLIGLLLLALVARRRRAALAGEPG